MTDTIGSRSGAQLRAALIDEGAIVPGTDDPASRFCNIAGVPVLRMDAAGRAEATRHVATQSFPNAFARRLAQGRHKMESLKPYRTLAEIVIEGSRIAAGLHVHLTEAEAVAFGASVERLPDGAPFRVGVTVPRKAQV